MNEQWKPVLGFVGIYEASNMGRVRRIAPWCDGRKTKPGVLSCRPNKKVGYVRTLLTWNGRRRYCNVHNLVMEAFVGPKPTGYQVNHKNGKKSDNRLDNLEYVTASQNNFHRYRVLRCPSRPGSKHHASKVSEADVLAMRALRNRGWTLNAIASQFGLSRPTVCWICLNKSWKHI